MTVDSSLANLDISNNALSYTASKLLGHLVKATTRLEGLNMANCGLRSSSSREIANALLFNQTIKFLNLSMNNFSSKDHELASKLARMI
jgi:Ran GTPase-activating protein (RanGAP) involved in mRNA processing and transport